MNGIFCLVLLSLASSTVLGVEEATSETNQLPHDSWFVEEIIKRYINDSSVISVQNLTDLMLKLQVNGTEIKKPKDHAEHYRDMRSSSNKLRSCYTVDELVKIYNITDDLVTKEDLTSMSAALVYMTTSSQCRLPAILPVLPHKSNCVSVSDVYLYGSISIVLIWFTSFMGVVIVGRIKSKKDVILLSLRSLGAGILIADALMHIVPSTLGLHTHTYDGQDHVHNEDHTEADGQMEIIMKMCVIVGTLFFFWMFESVMSGGDGHGHSHGQIGDEKAANGKHVFSVDEETGKEGKVEVEKKKSTKEYLKSVQINGWVAFLGDNLHKVADGFAIGAAYSQSLSLGISTSLAIMFHEIPHELGDFAVLLSAGFNYCTILILNTVCSTCSLVAFLIIAAISPGKEFREWIFAIIAGVFFYIALVNMLPSLRKDFEPTPNRSKLVTSLIVSISFIVGWILMLLLAIYEDDLKIQVPEGC